MDKYSHNIIKYFYRKITEYNLYCNLTLYSTILANLITRTSMFATENARTRWNVTSCVVVTQDYIDDTTKILARYLTSETE